MPRISLGSSPATATGGESEPSSEAVPWASCAASGPVRASTKPATVNATYVPLPETADIQAMRCGFWKRAARVARTGYVEGIIVY